MGKSLPESPVTRTLDARGLLCPEPVIRTRLAMREVGPGESLKVLATDPAALMDIPYYVHATGLELVEVEKRPDLLVFTIRKPPSRQTRKRRRATSDSGG